jgi:GTPase SAR1 family protein
VLKVKRLIIMADEKHGPDAGVSPSKRESHKKGILELCEEKVTVTKESQRLVQEIKKIYKTKILPIEKKYRLHSFCLPTNGAIEDAEFDARPMVLLLGQYSTGKTTFIRHLLGQDFPGMHIGPEPTSDKFMALIHGDDHKIIKGNTLTVMPELHFYGLSQFGSTFLNHFNGSVTNSPLLNLMNVIDTPGILSGEKQRLSRQYPFSKTAKWFADRSDLILLLFDAHKLDISDEFKEVVDFIRPHNDDKIRCVLNKADQVEKDQLVRVYGSLLWSMGKLFSTPEVARVYTGSYWDKPLLHDDFEDMFNTDEELLMDELIRLPSVSAERKVNAVVKRIRLVKVHICILGHIRQCMPIFYGQASARRWLLSNLEQIFETVRNQWVLPEGDMPNVDEFRERLSAFEDFNIFPLLDDEDIETLHQVLATELPCVLRGSSSVSDTSKTPTKSKEETKLAKETAPPSKLKTASTSINDTKLVSAKETETVSLLSLYFLHQIPNFSILLRIL